MKSKTNQYRSIFFQLGLAASLGIVLFAFEWKSAQDVSEVTWEYQKPIFDGIEEQIPPVTKVEIKKPVVITPIIKEVDNTDDEAQDDLELLEFDDEIIIPDLPDEVIEVEVKEEIVEDGPLIIVEKNAEFEGGQKAFYQYMADNMKYPRQAKNLGIEGRVFVTFTIEKMVHLQTLKLPEN